MKQPNLELVGHIGVDAGCVYLGDPCYIIGDGKTKHGDWMGFCEKYLHKAVKGVVQIPFELNHYGEAIIVDSGYGDGEYPVYVERRNGHIARVIIDFMEDEDAS